MPSNINPAWPEAGTATTQSVRQNFAAARNEIEALQAGMPPAIVYRQPGEYVWTCQRSGRYQMMVVGGGGGGAVWVGQGTSPPFVRAGGSGATGRLTLDIIAGQILQVRVPRGGGVLGSLVPDLYPRVPEHHEQPTRIIWPYAGARNNGVAIPGYDTAHVYLMAPNGIDGSGGTAGPLGGIGPPAVYQAGVSPSGNLGANGVQVVGTSLTGPVQLTSGHGGALMTPGGSGAALIAFISPL